MEPEDLSAEQRRHWESVYRENPQMYGPAPSTSGTYAAELFSREGRASDDGPQASDGAPPVRRILELGAGHGRDSLHFARTGFEVVATDFSAEGIDQLSATAAELGLADRLTAALQDVRQPLPHPDGSFDAVYAHLLLSMALSTGSWTASSSARRSGARTSAVGAGIFGSGRKLRDPGQERNSCRANQSRQISGREA